MSTRARRRVIPHRIALALVLLVTGCASDVGDDAATESRASITADGSSPSVPAAVEATEEPEPAYAPPVDWQERALEAAERARQGVVAIGWNPPGPLDARLEAGWLVAPDLVVTSNLVACEAREGTQLRVRTFSGAVVAAGIEAEVGGCDGWDPGLALVRLERDVTDPVLILRTAGAPEVGEPLLAIGHANHARILGGWLVAVGPMVATEGTALLADVAVPVQLMRFDEWFGGGANGAPLIDLAGDVVAVLCCERDWGPQLRYDDAFAEPVLRRRIVLDSRYHVVGLWGEALRDALSTAGAIG
jgi:hypothetical protein